MILFAFFYNPQGDHRMAWRHAAAPGSEVFGLDYYKGLAGAAEAAKIDAIFIADHLGIWDTYPSGLTHYANPRLEPLTLVAALSALTTNIGFLVTASTSYTEPYNLARTFASLDHLSRGRIGWNVVTSALDEEARNFGLDTVKAHATRYARADEFLDVAEALWDSWEDGALVIDKATSVFADTSKVYYLDHAGTHFRVKGPLNVPHSPQGRPVIVQAGSSPAGRDLAAAHADLHFIIARKMEDAVQYRADMNDRLARHGRAPESLKLIPGVLPIVAASAAEAADRQRTLASLMPDPVSIDLLSSWAGVDLSRFPPDGPVPDLPDPGGFEGWKTWLNLVHAEANQGLTIRDLARKIANTGAVPLVAGTAAQIADELEAWTRTGAADGFNLMFPLLPDDWMAFMRDVVPELQRRGLMQSEYRPGTMPRAAGLAARGEQVRATETAEGAASAMTKAITAEGEPPSRLIDARIKELDDWRGKTLSEVRALIQQADPEVVEEWKWRGVPVWSDAGLICTGETYKSVVKLTFAKGAALEDPSGLFNSSLEGNVRRAIDLREGEVLDEEAFKALIGAAVALNRSSAKPRKAARKL